MEISSRNFNPATIFNEIKLQHNLAHLETRIRTVVEFIDVRILVFGTLTRPRSQTSVNTNAHLLLNPPGIECRDLLNGASDPVVTGRNSVIEDHGVYPAVFDPESPISPITPRESYPIHYNRISRPCPSQHHHLYPFYTPGGGDTRWDDLEDIRDQNVRWVGSMMVVTQIISPNAHEDPIHSRHWASFTWADLWAIAPWLEDIISKRIDGPGLGH